MLAYAREKIEATGIIQVLRSMMKRMVTARRQMSWSIFQKTI